MDFTGHTAISRNNPFSKQRGKTAANVTALYARLSKDDDIDGVSNSIANQEKILRKFAEDNGYRNIRFYFDDGVTGTTFDRPQWNQLIADVEKGEVATVIVKDLSRFGRDYILAGYYSEVFFPDHDVHFLTVNDDFDSERESNDFAPLKNLFNEWYARDTSRKIKAVLHNKGISGGILSVIPPFGYVKDKDRKDHWLIDENAAEVVRTIFRLYMDGLGYIRIANYLEEHHVLTPYAYAVENDLPIRIKSDRGLYEWCEITIETILKRREYCGDIVNFKTYRKSHKNHKVCRNPADKQMVFENINDPIISREVFDKVQELISRKQRVKKTYDPDIMHGFLYCADCGKRMVIRRSNTSGRKDQYFCYGYTKHGLSCTNHMIRRDNLCELVLENINELIKQADVNYEALAKDLYHKVNASSEAEIKRCTCSMNEIEKRIKQISSVRMKLYEDRALGKIEDEQYFSFADTYNEELTECKKRLQELQAVIDKKKNSIMGTDAFLKLVKKCSVFEELSLDLLVTFIDKILVHQKNKETGEQLIEIFYKGVGNVE